MESKPWGIEHKTFITLMHLSQLTGYLIPFANVVLPVLMWAMNKDDSEEIDKHGKVILNWLVTVLIASAVCFVLTFILIGALGFIVLGLVNLAFIIIGAVKANQGELWPYPFSIKVFS